MNMLAVQSQSNRYDLKRLQRGSKKASQCEPPKQPTLQARQPARESQTATREDTEGQTAHQAAPEEVPASAGSQQTATSAKRRDTMIHTSASGHTRIKYPRWKKNMLSPKLASRSATRVSTNIVAVQRQCDIDFSCFRGGSRKATRYGPPSQPALRAKQLARKALAVYPTSQRKNYTASPRSWHASGERRTQLSTH